MLSLQDVREELEHVEEKFQQAKDVKRDLYEVYVEAYEGQDGYEPFENIENTAKRELRFNTALIDGVQEAKGTVEDLREAITFLQGMHDAETLDTIGSLIDWYGDILDEYDDILVESVEINQAFLDRQGEMDVKDQLAVKKFLEMKTEEIDKACEVLLDLEHGYNQTVLNWSTVKAVVEDIDEVRNSFIDTNAVFAPISAYNFAHAESPTTFWVFLVALTMNVIALAEASLIRPEWDNLREELHLSHWEALQERVS